MTEATHDRKERHRQGWVIVLIAGLVMTSLRFWILPRTMPGLQREPPFAAIDFALVSIFLTVVLGIVVATLYRICYVAIVRARRRIDAADSSQSKNEMGEN